MRACGSNSTWQEVSLLGCLSLLGQSLLDQIDALEEGYILSSAELRGVADSLVSFTAGRGSGQEFLSGEDVRVAGKLLSQLIQDVNEEVIGLFSTVASNLLNSDLSPAWTSTVREVEFTSGNFLFILEELALLLTETSSSTVLETNFLIKKELLGSAIMTFELSFNNSISSVSLKMAANNTASLTFALFPTLGPFLTPANEASFNFSHMTVATPILSIQALDSVGSEVTLVPVDFTLPYTTDIPFSSDSEEGGAICVSWDYK